MTPAARIEAAITLLAAIEAAPRAPADAVANGFFRDRRYIGGADRREVSDLVWGVLRQRLRLDWHCAHHGIAPTPRTLMLAWLRLQQRQPSDALAGLFAGARYGPAPLEEPERRFLQAIAGSALRDPAMDRASALNLPGFLLEPLAHRFGAALEREAAALEAPATLDLRVNLLKTDREAARAALAAEGLDAAPTPFSPWGLRLSGRSPVTATAAFRDGLVEIQDEGSQLIALLTDAQPGMRVLDYCAGAGGKTLAIAAAMRNQGQIIAADVSVKRLEAAVRRLRRAGIHNVERRAIAPAEKWLKRGRESFERVLVDAPCTGTGTWRRNPDGRFRLAPDDLSAMLAKQRQIARAAARLVKPGGHLVYATCSLLVEENDTQVHALLAEMPGFAVQDLAGLWARLAPGVAVPCDGPFLSLSPGAHGTDGFFCAVLRRAAPDGGEA